MTGTQRKCHYKKKREDRIGRYVRVPMKVMRETLAGHPSKLHGIICFMRMWNDMMQHYRDFHKNNAEYVSTVGRDLIKHNNIKFKLRDVDNIICGGTENNCRSDIYLNRYNRPLGSCVYFKDEVQAFLDELVQLPGIKEFISQIKYTVHPGVQGRRLEIFFHALPVVTEKSTPRRVVPEEVQVTSTNNAKSILHKYIEETVEQKSKSLKYEL
ncbi:MAG: hypothetical protein ACRDCE_00015, partial [Cetobacterium sp.]|uniref:hypothetical protein n=1 Tax=Cetobacterium sp. TaxID=2071632 RepID=UPI003EE4E188